jgi:hypothetical protein
MSNGSTSPSPEHGVFVVWPSDPRERKRILAEARSLFEIRHVYAIHWSPDRVAENRARFFREGPGPEHGRDAPTNPGPLLVLTVIGDAARAQTRTTPRGDLRVNQGFLEATQRLRALTAPGTRVHGSLSAADAARDLMLLVGCAPETHLAGHPGPWDGRVEEIARDLTGARGWRSPAELLATLNHTVRYIVIRNFENLPHGLHIGSHEDVDLLTDDYPELVRVMNARPHVRCIPRWGGPHWVHIGGADMWFDLRFVGDHYFDSGWAHAILDRRVAHPSGFYAPCAEDYFESLAYHAVVHKREFSADYRERLAAMARTLGRTGWEAPALEDPTRVKALLDAILARRGAAYRRPRDVNVFFNFEATGHQWPQLRRQLAALVRKGTRLGYRVERAARVRYREITTAAPRSAAPPTPRRA